MEEREEIPIDNCHGSRPYTHIRPVHTLLGALFLPPPELNTYFIPAESVTQWEIKSYTDALCGNGFEILARRTTQNGIISIPTY